jgi:hypothetical protein
MLSNLPGYYRSGPSSNTRNKFKISNSKEEYEMRGVPELFRQTADGGRFRDLSTHLFSFEDITWLCDEMNGKNLELDSDHYSSPLAVEKMHLAFWGRPTRINVKSVLYERYRLHNEGLEDWLICFNDNQFFASDAPRTFPYRKFKR